MTLCQCASHKEHRLAEAAKMRRWVQVLVNSIAFVCTAALAALPYIVNGYPPKDGIDLYLSRVLVGYLILGALAGGLLFIGTKAYPIAQYFTWLGAALSFMSLAGVLLMELIHMWRLEAAADNPVMESMRAIAESTPLYAAGLL